MRRLLFLIFNVGIVCSICAQTGENIFEWGTDQTIVIKRKFLEMYKGLYTNDPTYPYKEYDISTNVHYSYKLKIKGFDKTMPYTGEFDSFEIYHNGKKILDFLSYGHLYDVRYLTLEKLNDYYIKVPLSEDSFALFFGGWLFGSGDETPEMVIAVVSADKAEVVFDDEAYAYKYTLGENFSIEFIDDINGLHYENDTVVFTDSYLKSRTKYKIWREGNMLKYKSWK